MDCWIDTPNILDCLNFNTWELDDLIAGIVCLIVVAVWCKNPLLSKPPAGYHLYFISPQREDGLDKGRATPEQKVSRRINDRMNELKKDIVVFWGSQSGQSERLAKEFVRECATRFGPTAMAADIDMFDFDELATMPKGRYVGFIVATYGEGDPTDNATGLYDYLHALNKQTAQPLGQLQYFCFGLGSSQYQSYNQFVDFVDESLSSAGGRKIAPVGKLDEALRLDEPWLSWKEHVMKELAARFEKVERTVTAQISKPTVSLVKSSTQESRDRVEVHAAELSAKAKHQQQAQIAQITKIQQISRQYLHVELATETGSGSLNYQTGDHLAIWPINPNHEVDLIADVFGWDDQSMNQIVTVQMNNAIDDFESSTPLETPTTRDSILRYQLDICGQPLLEIVSLMAMYCPTTEGREYLKRFMEDPRCWEERLAQHLTCAQLMHRATSEKWPEELFCTLLQTLPRLRPRYYSIASSSVVDPKSIVLTVSVVQTQLPDTNRAFFGLTTGYLRSFCDESERRDAIEGKSASCTDSPSPLYDSNGPRGILDGRKLFAYVRPTPFNLPTSSHTPIIMFAAGSGIAPFRAFVQERLSLKTKGDDIGRMTLFFGCRSRDELLFADLWEEAARGGILETHIALSADPVRKRKIYIQDLLEGEIRENVAEAIVKNGAVVYICGSAKMVKGVKGALDDILKGKTSVGQLKELKRLHEDVWIS